MTTLGTRKKWLLFRGGRYSEGRPVAIINYFLIKKLIKIGNGFSNDLVRLRSPILIKTLIISNNVQKPKVVVVQRFSFIWDKVVVQR
jgi:hypothetical protein